MTENTINFAEQKTSAEALEHFMLQKLERVSSFYLHDEIHSQRLSFQLDF